MQKPQRRLETRLSAVLASLRLELESYYKDSIPRLPELGAGSVTVDVAVTARGEPIQCSLGPKWAGRGWIVQVGPIENVIELHPNVQAHSFPDPEDSAEIHVFLRMPLISKIAVKLGGIAELTIRGIGPCILVKHKGGRWIIAVAVEIDIVERLSRNAVHQCRLEQLIGQLGGCRRSGDRQATRVLQQGADLPVPESERQCPVGGELWYLIRGPLPCFSCGRIPVA